MVIVCDNRLFLVDLNFPRKDFVVSVPIELVMCACEIMMNVVNWTRNSIFSVLSGMIKNKVIYFCGAQFLGLGLKYLFKGLKNTYPLLDAISFIS